MLATSPFTLVMTPRVPAILQQQSLTWLLNSATEAMLIADDAGTILLANPPAETLFAYAAGDMPGKRIEDLLPQRFRHHHAGLRGEFFGQPRAREMGAGLGLYGQRQDGSEFPVEVSLSPLEAEQGKHLVLATIHDISRRKAAETSLQESEARMRAVFETAVDGIITIDERGIIEGCNVAAERLFGYRSDELAGKNIKVLMPSPYREQHDGYLASYRNTGEKKIIGTGREVLGQRRDGSVFPLDLAVAEMKFGERRMFTGVVRDITRAKEAEEALRQSQDALRRLSQHQENLKEAERKRIAQEIHDELGGLLTGIKAHLSVLQDRGQRAGMPAEPLLAEALVLADSGFAAVRRVITDLRPSVLDQLGVWAALEWYAGQIEKRSGLACRCELDISVVDLVPDPDTSTMLFRIVQEALTNVVRHAQASSFTVRARWKDGLLTVEVEDDGRGFDRDARSDSWGIVGMHERVRHFGGTLTITSMPGNGTIVSLRMPLESADAE